MYLDGLFTSRLLISRSIFDHQNPNRTTTKMYPFTSKMYQLTSKMYPFASKMYQFTSKMYQFTSKLYQFTSKNVSTYI